MKGAVKDWGLALVVGLAVFFLAEWLSTRNVRREGAAPEFELVNVAGGTTSLADFDGKPVVLNFWGSWCPPCRKEIPEFAAFVREHPDVPVLGIAVNSGSGDQLKKSADALGINYPVLESTDQVLQAYGVDAFPTTIVVAPDGGIASVYTGGIGKTTLERAVDAVAP